MEQWSLMEQIRSAADVPNPSIECFHKCTFFYRCKVEFGQKHDYSKCNEVANTILHRLLANQEVDVDELSHQSYQAVQESQHKRNL